MGKRYKLISANSSNVSDYEDNHNTGFKFRDFDRIEYAQQIMKAEYEKTLKEHESICHFISGTNAMICTTASMYLAWQIIAV